MDLFDQAIETSIANGVTQDEALAKELAGEFYILRGRNKFGQAYLKESYYAYVKWNCVMKYQALDRKIAKPLKPTQSQTNNSTGGSWESSLSLSSTPPTTLDVSSDMLDLSTLVKASQALLG